MGTRGSSQSSAIAKRKGKAKPAGSDKKIVGEVKEITLRERRICDKAREGNLHKKVRMPTYNILIQHINNAKKYDFRYKNILEEKKTLRHLSEDILFSELRSCVGDIPVGQNKKNFKATSHGGCL